jgi:ABC-type multidrug transport system ATPase subunit
LRKSNLKHPNQIKGYSKKEIKEDIVHISTYVGLQNDLKKRSKQLSGGMKRRLSVAMALTGGSKIIILDEPTSGLDPFNRRSLWELIRKFKQGRSIVLTTHFMEGIFGCPFFYTHLFYEL